MAIILVAVSEKLYVLNALFRLLNNLLVCEIHSLWFMFNCQLSNSVE